MPSPCRSLLTRQARCSGWHSSGELSTDPGERDKQRAAEKACAIDGILAAVQGVLPAAPPGHEVSGLRDGTGSIRFEDGPSCPKPVSTGGVSCSPDTSCPGGVSNAAASTGS